MNPLVVGGLVAGGTYLLLRTVKAGAPAVAQAPPDGGGVATGPTPSEATGPQGPTNSPDVIPMPVSNAGATTHVNPIGPGFVEVGGAGALVDPILGARRLLRPYPGVMTFGTGTPSVVAPPPADGISGVQSCVGCASTSRGAALTGGQDPRATGQYLLGASRTFPLFF
jgi:hypothetical protein